MAIMIDGGGEGFQYFRTTEFNIKECIIMQLITTHICKTSDIGICNNLFGGTMLAWLDEAGAAFASSYCKTKNMVTLKISEVLFLSPVKVNTQVRLYGSVNKLGNTSITIDIEARNVDVRENTESLVCSTTMVFVKIDEEGKATKI
jgi:acyl-CoA thioesterase YciA